MSEPDFIVPPPGLVPDASDGERTEAEGTMRAERALPGFRPPPGIRPPSALPIAPPAHPRTPPAPPADRAVPAPTTTTGAPAPGASPTGPWHLRTAEGFAFSVIGRVVAGRDPNPPNWLQGATVVAVPDHTRSMSKTHALLESADGRLLLTDLDSTNGVRVWPEGAEPTDLEPGVPAEVPLDAVILLGDVAFLVERAPAESV